MENKLNRTLGIVMVTATLFLNTPFAFAGSEIEGKVINQGKSTEVGIAMGIQGEANQNSIVMKDTKIKGEVINMAEAKVGIAMGIQGEANQNSIITK